ncbi:MAG: hypothetical protein LKE96_00490 [Acetobacter peroxydans]|nr:hypothetical protein [Acetobacter peroxydans]
MVSRFLVLDASPAGDAARGLAACLEQHDGALSLVGQCEEAGKQAAEGINLLAARALEQAGWQDSAAPAPDCVAVVIGPGSFTGAARLMRRGGRLCAGCRGGTGGREPGRGAGPGAGCRTGPP